MGMVYCVRIVGQFMKEILKGVRNKEWQDLRVSRVITMWDLFSMINTEEKVSSLMRMEISTQDGLMEVREVALAH